MTLRAVRLLALVGLCAGLVLTPGRARGQSLDAQLASAQDRAALAEQRLASANAAVKRAQRQLQATTPKTQRAAQAAAAALADVAAIEASITEQRTDALEEVMRVESEYREDQQDHENSVALGFGLGIGTLLVAGAVALWTRFRELGMVQRQAEGSWPRAVAIVCGSALVLLLVGGFMLGGPTLVRAFGAFLAVVAVGGAALVLVARHSLRVERREDGSLLSRNRFPRWVVAALSVLLFLLAAAGLGDAVSSDEPAEPAISAETRALAEAAKDDPLDPPTPALLAARRAAAPLVARAKGLKTAQNKAQQALAQARQTLRASRRRLRRTQLAASRLSRKVAREAARQAALAAPPSSVGGGGSSSPSFSSCDGAPSNIPVPPGSSLDGDGDGIGCED